MTFSLRAIPQRGWGRRKHPLTLQISPATTAKCRYVPAAIHSARLHSPFQNSLRFVSYLVTFVPCSNIISSIYSACTYLCRTKNAAVTKLAIVSRLSFLYWKREWESGEQDYMLSMMSQSRAYHISPCFLRPARLLPYLMHNAYCNASASTGRGCVGFYSCNISHIPSSNLLFCGY